MIDLFDPTLLVEIYLQVCNPVSFDLKSVCRPHKHTGIETTPAPSSILMSLSEQTDGPCLLTDQCPIPPPTTFASPTEHFNSTRHQLIKFARSRIDSRISPTANSTSLSLTSHTIIDMLNSMKRRNLTYVCRHAIPTPGVCTHITYRSQYINTVVYRSVRLKYEKLIHHSVRIIDVIYRNQFIVPF